MHLSANGRAFLIREEGSINKAYRDSKGVWTIGVGHTASAGPPVPRAGLVITDKQIDELLAIDIVKYEDIINRHIKVPLNQNEYDALVIFVFNIGETHFNKSTVKRLLNLGNRKGAADAFLLWKKAGDDPDILLPRRQRERKLFLSPYKATEAPEATPLPEVVTKPVSEPRKGFIQWIFSLLFPSSKT